VKCRNIANLKRLYAQTLYKKQTNSRQPDLEKIKNQIRQEFRKKLGESSTNLNLILNEKTQNYL